MGNDLEKYLLDINFKSQLSSLNRKLKNKKVVIYGAGLLFQTILKNYDLSKLNIIGISDGKFTEEDAGKDFEGFKIIPKDLILLNKPDYVLIATLNFIGILNDFELKLFNGSRVKVLPLAKKTWLASFKEIFR